jgi:hypothetical protein
LKALRQLDKISFSGDNINKLYVQKKRIGFEIMKKLFDWSCTVLSYAIPIGLVAWLLIIDYQGGFTFDQQSSLLKIIVWPAVVLIALFLFKKVVTYLFFSMDEFNFFGNKWHLRDIREVINEKVKELSETQKREEQRLIYENEIKTRVSALEKENATITEWRDLATDSIKLYKELTDDYKKIYKENIELNNQLNTREHPRTTVEDPIQSRNEENTVANDADESSSLQGDSIIEQEPSENVL